MKMGVLNLVKINLFKNTWTQLLVNETHCNYGIKVNMKSKWAFFTI